eukprot:COSAG01_NODE_3708_length_5771_cov_15.214210_2_plen_92_part_00
MTRFSRHEMMLREHVLCTAPALHAIPEAVAAPLSPVAGAAPSTPQQQLRVRQEAELCLPHTERAPHACARTVGSPPTPPMPSTCAEGAEGE